MTIETQNSQLLRILILQGPNLNLLGEREVATYGSLTLDALHLRLDELSRKIGVELSFFQSNHEGALIDRIHETRLDNTTGIILNAGGLTHTSVSLRDALSSVPPPFIEVHISNVAGREEFRHHSFLSPIASGVVFGFGADGYRLALLGLVAQLRGERL